MKLLWTKEWYKNAIQQKLRNIILKTDFVETDNGEKVSLSEVYFPDPKLSNQDRETIWKFSRDLKINTLPAKQHIHNWAKLIWDSCSILNVNELATDLQSRKNIQELQKSLELSEDEVLSWMVECLNFILQTSSLQIFNSKSLTPNQKGIFKKLRELSNDLIDDDCLKDIALLLGSDLYEKLLHSAISFDEFNNQSISRQSVANTITNSIIKDLPNNSERILAIRKLIIWFEENPEESKNLFSELFRKKEKLLVDTIEDKDSLYKLLTSQIPLSKLAEFSSLDIDTKELNNLLNDFNASNISDLRDKLRDIGSVAENQTRTELNRDVLLSLGITSMEELKNALQDRDFDSQFFHKSMPTQEMFFYAKEKIDRSKKNITHFLQSLPQYDCNELEELAPTIIGGIRKKGRPVNIVIRPSDNGEVIIHYSSEKDALDFLDDEISVELWIDNGIDDPKILTLGAILKKTGINRIPV
ncbi:hypothetical protein IQ273_17105 [Nodosilinea sp. LEGE 07298]|uniref:hypothetical protein n=1 Tax=Nodosilinea sp. LEGE 07298 TaxID=2777970 RepID=UPI00187F36A5|nr:hypothetical protein [Nodosilinea sp. LEGE 07298]MBE9111126.1 hypothetical protein [Nodosilinea sp. LEGE 07298]